MTQVTTELHDSAVETFPGIAVSGFLVKDLDQAVANAAKAWSVETEFPKLSLENLANYQPVAAWRVAFLAMRLKPSTFKSSIEQLLRRRLKGERVRTSLPIVNTYCEVSTAWSAPMGGYDVERLPENLITIRCARPGLDSFAPLAGKAAEMPMTESVVVYASGSEILCWALNHRDSKVTCLQPHTRIATFFSESVVPEQQDAMHGALADMRTKLQAWGATAGPTVTLSNAHRRATLEVT